MKMEAQADSENKPQTFEVALNEEQATAIVEELSRGMERMR